MLTSTCFSNSATPSNHYLFVEKPKRSFGVNEVEYLGHIMDRDGVWVDPKSIKSMMDWPHPKP